MHAQRFDEPHQRTWQASAYRIEIGLAQLPEHGDGGRNSRCDYDTQRDAGAGGTPRLEENSHGEGDTTGDSRCDQRAELNAEIGMPRRFGDS